LPNRLAGLHHAHDAFLGLGMVQQFHEGLALEVEQPLLADQAALIDVAAGHDAGDHLAQLEVVGGDEAAVTHVDQLHHDGADGITAGHGHQFLQGRTVAGIEHRARFDLRHVQQLVGVEDDHVIGLQVAHLPCLQRRL
jgi:hypothetical protein